MIHNSHPNANYFENTYENSKSVDVPQTSDTSVSLPNPNINSMYVRGAGAATFDQFIQRQLYDAD